MAITEYLGFRVGDYVLDAAELTAGTARIKAFEMVPDGFATAVVAIMENGAERFVTQLKKAPPPEPGERVVVRLGRRPRG
jgi:hypothetical protein